MAQALSKATEELLDGLTKLQQRSQELPIGEAIRVSSLTEGLGFIYEKIRNALLLHEEHLWTKDAIFRILKRRFYEMLAGRKIARPLLEELIPSRYLENNSLAEGWVYEVDAVLEKYRRVFLILEACPRSRKENAYLKELELWFLGIAATELEETLFQAHHDRAFVTFFFRAMKERIVLPASLRKVNLNLEFYLASYRNFLMADNDMEAWTLFRLYFPEWENPRREFIEEIARDLAAVKARINAILRRPLRKELDRIFKKHSFLVDFLRELIARDPESARALLSDPDSLEKELRRHYQAKLSSLKRRLQRSVFRSAIFVLALKAFSAAVFEIPYLLANQELNLFFLTSTTLLPALLVFGIGRLIRVPDSEDNFLQFVMAFQKLIRQPDGEVVLDNLHLPKTRSIFGEVFITFGILVFLLAFFNFNWPSAILLLLFLSFAALLIIRFQKTAKGYFWGEEQDHPFLGELSLLG